LNFEKLASNDPLKDICYRASIVDELSNDKQTDFKDAFFEKFKV